MTTYQLLRSGAHVTLFTGTHADALKYARHRNADTVQIYAPRADIVTIPRAVLNDVIEALVQASEYFEDRQDADGDSVGFIPNEEMKLNMLCAEALAGLPGAEDTLSLAQRVSVEMRR
jgi:hypothetical protein